MKGKNFMKKIIIFITLLSTMACTNTNINNSYKQSKEEFQIYQEISNNYKIDKEWWKEYNNSELNNIMNIALKNNSDLKKAAINVNKALYQANLLGADLVPSFSSSLGTSAYAFLILIQKIKLFLRNINKIKFIK